MNQHEQPLYFRLFTRIRCFLTLIFALAAIPVQSQVKIIFDTDIGGDADDLGALVMLNNFHERSECELLGVMCWSTEKYAVPAIDAVNRFYGHPDIPVGCRKDAVFEDTNQYCRAIASRFEYRQDHGSVPDATELYRKLLAKAADSSIVLVTVGPLKNIENLLNSPPDKISSLDGKSLMHKKIREVVIMGGQFPSGENEWNFDGRMPGVTKRVIPELEMPVTFLGFEVGIRIQTGLVFNDIPHDTPLCAGFLYFSTHAPWKKDEYTGKIIDNSTFDQTAVLYAVRNGVGNYWERITGGYCLPDESGGNRWMKGGMGNQSYLKLLKPPEEMATLIESLMLNEF